MSSEPCGPVWAAAVVPAVRLALAKVAHRRGVVDRLYLSPEHAPHVPTLEGRFDEVWTHVHNGPSMVTYRSAGDGSYAHVLV